MSISSRNHCGKHAIVSPVNRAIACGGFYKPVIPSKRVPLAHRYARPFYFAAGMVFVALGYIGAFLPVMPSTIFFILALNSFRRCNPKLERWILNTPLIGPILREWDESGAIHPRTKVIIVVVLWLSIIGSVAAAMMKQKDSPVLVAVMTILLSAAAIGVTHFVLTRPNAKPRS